MARFLIKWLYTCIHHIYDMQTREAKIQNMTNTDNLSSPIQLPVFWIKANNTNQFRQTKCQRLRVLERYIYEKGYNIYFFKMNEKKR